MATDDTQRSCLARRSLLAAAPMFVAPDLVRSIPIRDTLRSSAGALASVFDREPFDGRDYRTTFFDDFTDPDLRRINETARPVSSSPAWRSRYRHARLTPINSEKQIYMDVAFAGTGPRALGVQPFSIRGSVLHITADKADPERVGSYIKGARYTSGCITTELTFWQTYGFFEMRAKLPRGKGFWPAFWLLPKAAKWPPELDPMEGSGTRPNSYHAGSVVRPRPENFPSNLWVTGLPDLTRDFYRYSLEWTPSDLIYRFEDRVVLRQPNFCHEPMYLLANLALGSRDPVGWIPDPDETTPFPSSLAIDYIKAMSREATAA